MTETPGYDPRKRAPNTPQQIADALRVSLTASGLAPLPDEAYLELAVSVATAVRALLSDQFATDRASGRSRVAARPLQHLTQRAADLPDQHRRSLPELGQLLNGAGLLHTEPLPGRTFAVPQKRVAFTRYPPAPPEPTKKGSLPWADWHALRELEQATREFQRFTHAELAAEYWRARTDPTMRETKPHQWEYEHDVIARFARLEGLPAKHQTDYDGTAEATT